MTAASLKPSTLKRARALAAAVPDAADGVLLGDSLAAGWPADLWAPALPGSAVFNFGLPGERARETLRRLDAIPTGHLRPAWWVLLLGTNDLADGLGPEAIADGLAAVAARAGELWDRPAAVVLTIPWRAPCERVQEEARLAANAAILATARRRGATALAVDGALAPGDPSSLEPDGLHLARLGYERLTARLARRLRQLRVTGAR